jgi:DNA-binding SARP family transcriptional activator
MLLQVKRIRNCYTYLLIFIISVSVLPVYAQTYGLEFQGYGFVLDKRTELDLSPDKLLKFQDEFEISFDYKSIRKVPNSNAGLFGYIFRIVGSNDENYDLLSTPNPLGLNLILGKSNKMVPVDYSDQMVGKWINLRIKFLLKENSLVFYTPDSVYMQENIGFEKNESFKIIFGANDYKQFKSSDVPSMAIRDIIIYEKGKIKHHWPLNESDGNTSLDVKKRQIAKAINPAWLALNHQNWQEIYENEITGTISVCADTDNGNIFMVGKDQLTIFSAQNGDEKNISYLNKPLFFDVNFRSVFNSNDKKIYCYSVDELPFYSLDINNGQWNDSGSAINYQTKFRHHNHFYRSKDNSLYTFGGYGGHRYTNEIFKFDLTNSVKEELSVEQSVFQPRYLSGLGELNDTVYILGGYGSASGNQLINPQSYFNLIAYSLETGAMVEKFQIDNLFDDMVVGNSMWISQETREYYALIFSKVKFKNNLQLIKGKLDFPEVELVGDRIPFNFFDARSFISLYYMPDQDKLYTCISYESDNSTQIEIFSVNYPPNKTLNESVSPQKGKKSLIVFIVLAMLLIAGVVVYLVKRSKKNTVENKQSPNNKQGITNVHANNEKRNVTFAHHGDYNLIFFGGFQVFDKNAKDITNKFSPILKELFVLILLNTFKDDKGISSEKIIEILWRDKSEISARNNRSVYISKLKGILNEIGNCEISKETGYWKINFSEKDVKSDYLEFLKITSPENKLDKQQIIRLIDITQKRAFLLNLQYDWLDEFKANVSDRMMDTLVEYGQSVDVKTDADFIIHLADSIFTFDMVNEEAMILKCKAQYCQGKHGLAKTTYEKFRKDYLSMYGENYSREFPDFLKS